MECKYRFVLELRKSDDILAGVAEVEPDWEPAREWALFQALRAGEAAPLGCAALEPLWHEAFGTPFIGGFRVMVARDGRAPLGIDVPARYFAALASLASSALVRNGKLQEGETFQYRVAAVPVEPDSASDAPRFTVRAVPKALEVRSRTTDELRQGAVAFGAPQQGDCPVFIPREMLLEVAYLTRSAGARETGGVLVGHVSRDSATEDLFIEVTAQIPALHTTADATSLRFTSDTWTAVRAALALRRRHELMLGWWHSHPATHWSESVKVDEANAVSLGFLSQDDRLVHRTVFAPAHTVALVMTTLSSGDVSAALFGWREGLLERRAFSVTTTPDPTGETIVGADAGALKT